MGWIWPVLAFTIVAAIIVVSLLSARRSPDLPEAKGEAGRYGPESFPEIPWPEPTRVPTPREGGDGKAAPVTATAPERQH